MFESLISRGKMCRPEEIAAAAPLWLGLKSCGRTRRWRPSDFRDAIVPSDSSAE